MKENWTALTKLLVNIQYISKFCSLPFGGWIPNVSNLSLCVIGRTTASINWKHEQKCLYVKYNYFWMVAKFKSQCKCTVDIPTSGYRITDNIFSLDPSFLFSSPPESACPDLQYHYIVLWVSHPPPLLLLWSHTYKKHIWHILHRFCTISKHVLHQTDLHLNLKTYA